MKKSLLFLMTIFFAYSCGTLNIEKRRYNRGFYVNWNKSSTKSIEENQEGSSFVQKDEKNLETENVLADGSSRNEANSVSSINHAAQQRVHEDPICETEVITSAINERYPSLSESTEEVAAVKQVKALKKSEHPKHSIKEQKRTNHSTTWFYGILSFLPFMYLFRKKISSISQWATTNNKQARGLILGLTGVSAFSSFALGTLSGWSSDSTGSYLSLGVLATASVINALRINNGFNFIKNKLSFALSGTAGAFCFFDLGSRYGSAALKQCGYAEGELVLHPAVIFLLTLVLIAALIAAIGLIASLSCSIACNGSEVLAAFVLFGGSYLVIMFFVYAIQFVYRKQGQSTEEFWQKAAITSLFAILIFLLIIVLSGTL